MGFRFIHTADWQIGKPFAWAEPDVRSALTDARFDAIDTIGKMASEHSVTHVLVAGDVFDTEGPDPRTIVQALSRMERHSCRWWLLPGNHDFVRAGGLWDRIEARLPGNVSLIPDARSHELEDGVWLLPAPLIYRHQNDDPTESFDSMETPGAKLRIGLAHGSIVEFGAQGETKNQIAPDRAARSALDYLALGDWHGLLQVNSRTWYSGTPEVDRFQRDEPGKALLVALEHGSEPSVTELRTGKYQWLKREWRVDDFAGFEAKRAQLLEGCDPAATLLRLTLVGITSLTDRVAMLSALEDDLSHRFRYFSYSATDLVAKPSDDDLTAFAAEGILGAAASRLNARIQEDGSESPIARKALERLFVEHAKVIGS
ncbi:MAG: DNA repair exonuclease [Nitratireductor sp.]